MSFKMLDIDLTDAFRRYQAGEPAAELAVEMEISGKTFRRRLRLAGLTPRSQSVAQIARRAWEHPVPDLTIPIANYAAGMTMKEVCKGLPGFSRERIERAFLAAGAAVRRVSDAKKFSYSLMTAERRRALTMAANVAKRGKPTSIESAERRAKTVERTMQLAGRTDLIMAVWLAQRGIAFTMQKAVGRYNIDIAIHEPPIAIEIDGERHHFTEAAVAHSLQRSEFLLSCGWRLIEIRLKAVRYLLRESTADYVVSLIEAARNNEPLWSEHCVIWGNGDAISGIKDQSNDRPIVGSAIRIRDIGRRHLCSTDDTISD